MNIRLVLLTKVSIFSKAGATTTCGLISLRTSRSTFTRFCYHFVKKEQCRKAACQLIHENPKKAHYFVEGDINTTLFEDRMSLDIVSQHIDDIREQYMSNRKMKSRPSKNGMFLSVPELIRKMGLDLNLGDDNEMNSSPYRLKSPSQAKDESNTYSQGLYSNELRHDLVNNTDADDSEDDLKKIVFEFNDRYYVNEDQEIQKEVERFNKASTGSVYDNHHSDISADQQLNASGIMKRNLKFLFDVNSSNDDGSVSYGAAETSLIDEDTHRSFNRSGLRKYWFTDVFEDASPKENSEKGLNAGLYDHYLSGLYQPWQANHRDNHHRQRSKQPLIRKLQKEDYYYRIDTDMSREMKEKQMRKNRSGAMESFLDSPPKTEDLEETSKGPARSAQPLLINFIDEKALESQDNDKTSELDFTLSVPRKETEKLSKDDKKGKSRDADKPKASGKKNKKKKVNQVIIDDNAEDVSLFRTKPKKGKAKKNEIRQQQMAKSKVTAEVVIPDGVSEIPQRGLDESIDHENDEMIDDLIKNRADDLEENCDSQQPKEQLETTFAKESSPGLPETNLITRGADTLLPDGGDSKDKKKKKKKAKKATVAVKPGSTAKDQANEEVNQCDKEKDVAITEIDNMLRRSDNLILLMFDVLDNNFMAEEFYVDKRRHFSKYVYVSDLGSKGNK